MKVYDVIVVGCGAMGSAAAYQLGGHGLEVLTIDRFQPPHALGSSHGHTRLIRKAYFEHPNYVPMLQRAYQLWEGLEEISQDSLFLKTGLIVSGNAKNPIICGIKESADRHSLEIERVTPKSLQQ